MNENNVETIYQQIGTIHNTNTDSGGRSTGIAVAWPQTNVLTASGSATYTATLKALMLTNAAGNVRFEGVVGGSSPNGGIDIQSGSYLKYTQLPDNTSGNWRV
jgi:hypothetical protein